MYTLIDHYSKSYILWDFFVFVEKVFTKIAKICSIPRLIPCVSRYFCAYYDGSDGIVVIAVEDLNCCCCVHSSAQYDDSMIGMAPLQILPSTERARKTAFPHVQIEMLGRKDRYCSMTIRTVCVPRCAIYAKQFLFPTSLAFFVPISIRNDGFLFSYFDIVCDDLVWLFDINSTWFPFNSEYLRR